MASAPRPMMGKQAPKRIIVVPFKDQPVVDDSFFDQMWEKLLQAVIAIHRELPVPNSPQALFRACEDICRLDKGFVIYKRLQTEIEQRVGEIRDTLLASTTTDPITFLGVVHRQWNIFNAQLHLIRQIFLYLDRTYVLHTPGLTPIYDMGLQFFRTLVIDQSEIRQQLLVGLVELITTERRGDAVDRQLLKALVDMSVSLNFYSRVEERLLSATDSFYAEEGQRFIVELTGPQYLALCERRHREEGDRVSAYLCAPTRGPLLRTVEQRLVTAVAPRLLEKSFEQMMDSVNTDDLATLCTLLQRVELVDLLRDHLKAYVRKRGAEFASDPSRDATLVEDLLSFKERLDKICAASFSRRDVFIHTIQEAFEYFLNIRPNKPAELIAKFLDAKLRAGNKEASDQKLETVLDGALTLFRYIQGKDVFEAFYKKDLAKRLLNQKSASTDLEKSLLSKLKTECGPQFTNKLEGMFRDIELSHDMMNSFKEQSKYASAVQGFELDVSVLTAGFWPTYPPAAVVLPREMIAAQETFTQFYLSQYSGRRLTFQSSLGSCVIKSNFKRGKKELAVSLFQAIVLLAFNDADKLTFSELHTLLNIEDKELRRTLMSLSMGKIRILLHKAANKKEGGKEVPEIAPDDVFVYNADFTNNLVRIKINQILLRETVEEQHETTEKVFLDRQYQVDAAIVRIMKTRKTLKHEQLISELYTHIRFAARPTDIKRRIESLIEREFLERKKDDSSTYVYVA